MRAVGIRGGVDWAMQQTTFASMAWQNKGKITRRERFLAEPALSMYSMWSSTCGALPWSGAL